jgi:mono/diheme cytochrome c family protein
MKHVSRDKYGICIEAADEKFNESEVKSLLEDMGAVNITPVYFEEPDEEIRIFDPKFIGLLVLVVIVTSGATYFTLNKLMFMLPFNWMMEQEKVIAQDNHSIFGDDFAMREPVRGTIARGTMPYKYAGDPEGAGLNLKNPLLPTAEILALGKEKYNIYCSPCHGNFGEGDSRLKGQFPNPPSLHAEKTRNWSDGSIYHVITEGQNVMPAYTSQLDSDERWAVIHYVRALQRSFNAKESDLE